MKKYNQTQVKWNFGRKWVSVKYWALENVQLCFYGQINYNSTVTQKKETFGNLSRITFETAR